MKKIRTGIYGGSFNPIHNGHTQLGEWLCKEGCVDELWFLVSPLNPLKAGQTDLESDETRLRLAHLAVEESERLGVSDFEMHLPRPSYMYNTLQKLSKAYPERDFVLVIGADNWLCFDKWYKPEEIIQQYEIIIYPRDGYPIDTTTLPAKVLIVDSPLYNISSTEIRTAIKEGRCHGEWLNPKVWKEIKRKRIYR